jgi:hypothetical protein
VKRLSLDYVYALVAPDVLAIRKGGLDQSLAVILLCELERELLEQQLGRPLTKEDERLLHSENTWRKLIRRRVGPWTRPGGMEPDPAPPTAPQALPSSATGQAIAARRSETCSNEGRSAWDALVA